MGGSCVVTQLIDCRERCGPFSLGMPRSSRVEPSNETERILRRNLDNSHHNCLRAIYPGPLDIPERPIREMRNKEDSGARNCWLRKLSPPGKMRIREEIHILLCFEGIHTTVKTRLHNITVIH